MITIQIQENESFDRLSILEIKKFNSENPAQKIDLQEQIEELQSQINSSIGRDLAKKIYESEEYSELYNTNFKIFELIDKLNLYEKTFDFKVSEIAQFGLDMLQTRM